MKLKVDRYYALKRKSDEQEINVRVTRMNSTMVHLEDIEKEGTFKVPIVDFSNQYEVIGELHMEEAVMEGASELGMEGVPEGDPPSEDTSTENENVQGEHPGVEEAESSEEE